ncbi:MAG: RluA family pseudouridine synthase [Kiritimatiellales bacterium]|nr:RluA family pseudouridine synthase [Kiritimatiellales bacterium]
MKNTPRVPRRHRPKKLEILYEDRDIVVIDKEAGLLTNSPHRDEENTAERFLTDYVRKGNSKSRLRVYTVHRLDRDTSGLLVFAKSESVKQKLQDNWPATEKRYFAVVHGHLEQKHGKISGYLAENQAQFVYVTRSIEAGKWSETAFEVLKETAAYSALSITLLTGRKNQIRVHFADAGHPVVGDKKYGVKGDRASRMALHAMHLAFDHPYSGKRVEFVAPVPAPILRLVGGLE